MKTFLSFLLVSSIAVSALAQDSTQFIQRKNTIKIEFTQPLYPNSLVMSYERVIKLNQTICLTGGYEEFPTIFTLGNRINLKENLERGGFKAGGEYRFYLGKQNKYPAPHGVYIGPYLSYHDYNNKRSLGVDVDGNPELVNLTTDFRITNIGFELGYQFVLGSRWTIDIVAVGPSISRYNAKLKIDGEYTFDKEEIENEILLKLLERFPKLEEVLTNKEISSDGKLDSWAYGWRYQFLVGYHFGRKKN